MIARPVTARDHECRLQDVALLLMLSPYTALLGAETPPASSVPDNSPGTGYA
jgi:hypothetical protein